MFHDAAAHNLERRIGILLAVPAVILTLYAVFYHFAARLAF
jgi:hypothetical protein